MSFSFLSLVKYVQSSLKIILKWLIVFQLRMGTVLRVSQTENYFEMDLAGLVFGKIC